MDKHIAYLNGELIPANECKLSIYDMGIVIGAAVTDMLRTFNHKPFRIKDHVERFYRSCKYACIEPPVSIEETIDISYRVLEHNLELIKSEEELSLVYYMTAGENLIYAGSAGTPGKMSPTYVQHTFTLPFSLWHNYFTEGIHCVIPSIRHWPPECLSSKIKNRNRLHMWIGEHEAHLADPKAVPLFLDTDGNIAETGGSNFVIYKDGVVISPRKKNILRGISLQVLTELLQDLNIPFQEDDIQIFDAINADEAWLPTTPYCLGPVVKINGIYIGDGKPGYMWRKIIDKWSDLVEKNIYNEITGQ
jgi:branched-subunit amino acid aminotransferase/4-amino-4-deoxychorismate lyase